MLKIHTQNQFYESGITRKTRFIFQCCARKTFHKLVTHGIDFLIFCCFSIVHLSYIYPNMKRKYFIFLGSLALFFISLPNDFQHLKLYLTGTFHVRSYKILIPHSRLWPRPELCTSVLCKIISTFQSYLDSFTV